MDDSAPQLLGGLALALMHFVGLVLSLAALVLGLVGVRQRRRKRTFATLGTICGILVALLLVASFFGIGSWFDRNTYY